MKHITPNFKPIVIIPKKNIHGKISKPRYFYNKKITWPKEWRDSPTKRKLQK
jgi:hypothetical protein